jgi:hypothetical protein
MTVMDLGRHGPELVARIIEVAEQMSRKLGYRPGSRTRLTSGNGRVFPRRHSARASIRR